MGPTELMLGRRGVKEDACIRTSMDATASISCRERGREKEKKREGGGEGEGKGRGCYVNIRAICNNSSNDVIMIWHQI